MSAFLSADWTLLGRQVANHLWQSTLFAAVAGVLVLSLRYNHARMRHWLWMAASVKFLVPFSLIVAIGGCLGPLFTPGTAVTRIPNFAEQIAQPFALPDRAIGLPTVATPPRSSSLPGIIVTVWFCGFAGLLVNWQGKWRRVGKIVRASASLSEGREVEAMRRLQLGGGPRFRLVSSDAKLEPGIFGVLRPALWLPRGIGEYLSDTQLEAILAHELCHIRRRDNLLAAIHMVVEAAFWFHPLVWWLGGRLEQERERACDEEVMRLIGDPQSYAEGVLKVCEFYLTSPVFCAAGVTGADLKKRIKGIMTNRLTRELTLGRKALLLAAALIAIGVPVGIGLVSPPPIRAQSQPATPAASPAFEVASVKPSSTQARGIRMRRDPGLVHFINVALIDILADAYDVDNKIISGPQSLYERYDILAKVPKGAPASQIPAMLQALLLERFKMRVHRETKPTYVYALVVGRGGPKLERTDDAPAGDPHNRPEVANGSNYGFHLLENLRPPELGFRAVGVTMARFAALLKGYVEGMPVVDATGLQGRYNFTFEFDAGPEGREPPPGLFSAVQRLGLKLEARKMPVDILVVDRVEKPTAN